MRVGIAGLGKMGLVFAERMLGAGFDVAVWNRSPDKAKDIASRGAKVAATPAELVAQSDVVLSMVLDDAAVSEVFEGAEGMLSADCNGKLFIEMSTVMPGTHEALAKKVEAAGARFVECPVGGSTMVAREGNLLGIAGGEAADVERAKEVLQHLCRRIDHAGPIGAGAALKLAINLPLFVYWQALGEAVALCESYGFDPEWLIGMFAESSGGPNALKVRGTAIAKALSGSEVPVTADIKTLSKDLRLMLESARAKGNPSPLVEQTLASYERASEAGQAGLDCSAFPAFWAGDGRRLR